MSEITRNLSYNDIKLLKKNSSGREKKIEGRENQKPNQEMIREIEE